jgi:mono/diheme cytochrome c family protein
MNYPVWDLTTIGGGSFIALIAILHVFIAHLAVGGGLFLWITDRMAARRNDVLLTDYVRRHTWFFLLLTMVFGGVTGVGIWFIIALVQPSATSALIHNFVFGWAIEWVFFVGEIVALLVYHYRFTVLAERDRLRIAFLYFLFAWLSLVIINGILSFMLTPGSWLTTHGFWDGFFNPTYFPSLVLRTCMAAMMAGFFGFVTALRTKDAAFRDRLIKYCAGWLLYPLIGLIPSAAWYYYALPADVRVRNFVLNPQTEPFIWIFGTAVVVLFIAGVVLVRRSSFTIQKVLTVLLLFIGLSFIGGFEYLREIARKPYVIGGFMYTNSITTDQVPALNREGVLHAARWSEVREITAENRVQAGRELFRLECQSCHTIHGIRNDVVKRIKGFTYLGILAHLTGQGKVQTYMPPFVGTEQEKEALTLYLATELEGVPSDTALPPGTVASAHDSIPAFSNEKSDHVILVWNDLGMHCMTDGDQWFSFLPPANTLEAQVILRGDPPQLVHEGIELQFAVDQAHRDPSAHTDFWKFSESLYGKQLEKNVGLFGKGVIGVFDFDSTRNSFLARGIPLAPYADDGSYNPFPAVTIKAVEKSTGKILMTTRVIAPVSTEIGCRNCHGGGWKTQHSGLNDETAKNILAAHDRLNGTDLLDLALQGKPQLCQSCHPDPVLAAPGKPGVVDFSSAMHGWHASYMPLEGSSSCDVCHPSSPKGNTRCLRDPHVALGLDCTTCHGTMREIAVALVKTEEDKPAAQRLLAPLTAAETRPVGPRIAWTGQPDCLNCHTDFQKPDTGSVGFLHWTTQDLELYKIRTDDAGVRCPACHGSTHALYPTHNPMSRDRDNIQPLQYIGSRGPIGSNGTCAVCHRQKMQDAIHHANMEHPFRNAALLE